jgi:hypothetical protein
MLLILGGVVHGVWTNRWGRSEEAHQAAAKLDGISLKLGLWEGQRQTLTAAQVSQLQDVSGHFLAKYENVRHGNSVLVFVVAGRPGPIAEHTPDICYQAGGYKMTGNRRVSEPGGDFWTAVVAKTQAADQKRLRIYWAWGSRGEWSAPDNPRLTYAGQPALYKLYLIHEATSLDDTADEEPCRDLIKKLLPELQRALFGVSESSGVDSKRAS